MTGPSLLGDQCQVHRFHRPPVLETELHHIQPRGMGGADTPANRVAVCGTGHANVHVNMRRLCRDAQARLVGTRSERALARAGFEAWVAAGRPGRPE